MGLRQKIILISFAAALLLGVLIALAGGGMDKKADFFMLMGMVGFFAGLLQFVAGLFLLIKTDKRYAQGFLMSAGILMLIGFSTCTAFLSLNIH
jgi:hypothetical protein